MAYNDYEQNIFFFSFCIGCPIAFAKHSGKYSLLKSIKSFYTEMIAVALSLALFIFNGKKKKKDIILPTTDIV